MRVSLNLNEQAYLFDLLNNNPTFKEGNVITWRQIIDTKTLLGITEKDIVDYKVVDGIADRELAKKEREFTLPDTLYALIVSYLKGEDDKGKLTESQFFVWEKLLKNNSTK